MELDKKHYEAQLFLTIAAVVSFTAVLAALISLLFWPAPDASTTIRDLLILVLGALIVIYKDVYGFWFGSSAGSLRKSIMEQPGAEPPAGG